MERSVRLVVDVQIRPAVARDMPALGTWSGQVEGVFRPALDRTDRGLFVAVANGRFPIGHALVDLDAGVVSNVLVLAGFRDQGIGTALVHECEELLRRRGAGAVQLAVEKSNDGAIRLYERLGYQRVRETVETWTEPAPDGTMQPVGHPSWVMQKTL